MRAPNNDDDESESILHQESDLDPEVRNTIRAMIALLSAEAESATADNWREHFGNRSVQSFADGKQKSDLKRPPTRLGKNENLVMLAVDDDGPLVSKRDANRRIIRTFKGLGFSATLCDAHGLTGKDYVLARSKGRKASGHYIPGEIALVIEPSQLGMAAINVLEWLSSPERASKVLDMSATEYERQIADQNSDLSKTITRIVKNARLIRGGAVDFVMDKAGKAANYEFAGLVKNAADDAPAQGAHTKRSTGRNSTGTTEPER